MNYNTALTQEITQQQKIILTSEMLQSLKILQMPVYDLQQNILKELEENPLLETLQENVPLQGSGQIENYNSSNASDIVLKQLVEGNRTKSVDSISFMESQSDYVDPFSFIAEKKTLKDYLYEQVLYLNKSYRTISICKYIIENIDENGYLCCSVEEISGELKVQTAEANLALEIVQNFRPFGVAARNLKECLKIQLRKKRIEDAAIYKMIDECLELIADNKIKEISRIMGLEYRKIQQWCNIIKSLEPRPSRGFYTGDPENFIVPDAYIRKVGGELHIMINTNDLPQLTISPLYSDILINHERGQALDFVKEKLNSAVSFIKCIEDRNKTLNNILKKIVEIQKDYFELGEQYLKPMVISDIASGLGIHESTVSRAIKDKYIGTPYNTVKIKDLFTSGIKADNTEENISSKYLKNNIKKLIESENKCKPLSDQDISDSYKNMGIIISRRTVAKYREQMGIVASGKRKM